MSLVRLLNRAAESSSDGHSSSARAFERRLHGGFGGHGARCEGLERVLERGVLWKRTNTETFGRSACLFATSMSSSARATARSTASRASANASSGDVSRRFRHDVRARCFRRARRRVDDERRRAMVHERRAFVVHQREVTRVGLDALSKRATSYVK